MQKYTYSMEETTIELSSSAMTLPAAIRVVMVKQPEADDYYKVESAARDFKYTGTHYFLPIQNSSSMILVRGLRCWRYFLEQANHDIKLMFVIGTAAMLRLRLPVIISRCRY